MAILTKLRQSLWSEWNEMIKGPLWEWRFLRKWQIWRKLWEWRKFVIVLWTSQMIWQRGSVQSSDFDDNGQFKENKEYGENSSKSARIQMRWQRAPLKEAILTKIANMAKIRQSQQKFKWDGKGTLWKRRLWGKLPIWQLAKVLFQVKWDGKAALEKGDFDENCEFGAKFAKAIFRQIRHCEHFWT